MSAIANWFGGPRDRSSRGRDRASRKPPTGTRHSRGRRVLERNPLAGLELPEIQTSEGESRRRKHAPRKLLGLGLGHFICLLVGLLLGAGLFVGLNRHYSTKYDKQAEPTEQVETAKATAPSVPRPVVLRRPPAAQATSPVEAVRLLLKATIAGDESTAYAQWGIGPDEIGTVRSGQELTLREMMAIARQKAPAMPLDSLQLQLRSQTGASAVVLQLHEGAVQQVYSLRKHGPYWKVHNASLP